MSLCLSSSWCTLYQYSVHYCKITATDYLLLFCNTHFVVILSALCLYIYILYCSSTTFLDSLHQHIHSVILTVFEESLHWSCHLVSCYSLVDDVQHLLVVWHKYSSDSLYWLHTNCTHFSLYANCAHTMHRLQTVYIHSTVLFRNCTNSAPCRNCIYSTVLYTNRLYVLYVQFKGLIMKLFIIQVKIKFYFGC